MTVKIAASNAPDAYVEAYWTMKAFGKWEMSRAGPVMSIPQPVVLEVTNPLERVITDPERNCNPFFHVMETVWMLAGADNVGFPSKFNSTYVNYAEPDGHVHGAYGKRWRGHFRKSSGGHPKDQILTAVAELKKDTSSRQIVLGMWDPSEDLGASVRDRPCNTHIYLRVVDNRLDMTVCNRSNDLLWGMLGANIVHMTYLQELIALGVGVPLGKYRVFTNNLHVYIESDVYKRFQKGPILHDVYLPSLEHKPLIQGKETVESLLVDCEYFVTSPHPSAYEYRTNWVNEVVVPMYMAWEDRPHAFEYVQKIKAEDWRIACKQWIERRTR